MKKTLTAAVIGLALAACSASSSVVTVDGVTIDLDDVPITTASSTIDLDVFRNALNWVIRDEVLMAAAAEEFGISLPEDEVIEQAMLEMASLSAADQEDPRANLDYFLIQARVGLGGLLWPRLPDGVTPNQWSLDKLSAADVEVGARFGEWRVSPEPLVYEP